MPDDPGAPERPTIKGGPGLTLTRDDDGFRQFVDDAVPVVIDTVPAASLDEVKERILSLAREEHRLARAGEPSATHGLSPLVVLDQRGTGIGKTGDNVRLTFDLFERIDEDPILSGANLLDEDPASRGQRVIWQVQSHRLARELAERLETERQRRGAHDVEIVIHHGLEQPVDPADPDGEQYCRRAEEVGKARACGAGIEHVCGGKRFDKGELMPLELTCCPFHPLVAGDDMCRRKAELQALRGLRRKKVVMIFAGAHFATHNPPSALRSVGAAPSTDQKEAKIAGSDDLREVMLPEAMCAFFDEWRPVDNHVRGTAEVRIEDLLVAASTWVPDKKEGDWRTKIRTSALGTKALFNHEVPTSRDVLHHEVDIARLLKKCVEAIQELEKRERESGNWEEQRSFCLSADPFKHERGKEDAFASVARALMSLILNAGDQAVRKGVPGTLESWDAIYNRSRGREERRPAPEDVVLMAEHNGQLFRVRRFLMAMQDAVNDAKRRNNGDWLLSTVRVHVDDRGEAKIQFESREHLGGWLNRTPLVILDATAIPEVVEQWTGKLVRIQDNGVRKLSGKVRVRQIADDQFSYQKIMRGETMIWPERIRAHIDAASVMHGGTTGDGIDVGVVMPKDLLPLILGVGGDLPDNVGVLTFGQEAGVNSLRAVTRGIIVSRKLMSSVELAHVARTVFGLNIPFIQAPNIGDNGGPPLDDEQFMDDMLATDFDLTTTTHLKETEGGMIQIGGLGKMCVHKWEMAEMVRRYTTDATMDQALGRFRAHQRNGERRVLLDILTSHPASELPIHAHIPADQFIEQAGNDAIRLAAAGVLKGRQVRGWRRLSAVLAGRGRARFERALGQIAGQDKDDADRMTEADAKRLAADAAVTNLKRSIERDETSASTTFVEWQEEVSLTADIPDGDDRYETVSPAEIQQGDERWLPTAQELSDIDQRPAVPVSVRILDGDQPVQCFVRLQTDHPDPCADVRQRLDAMAGFPLAEVTFLTGVRPKLDRTFKPKVDRKTGELVMEDGPAHVPARANDREKGTWPPADRPTIAVRSKIGDREMGPWVHLRSPK